MDRFAKLVMAAAAVLLSGITHAGYAWPADPAGFVRSGPWGNGYGYAAGANDSTFGKIIHQQNGLKYSVGGRAVTMPVAYRFAQNAPRFAAAAIFAHPGVRTAVGIASWLGVAKLVWDETNKRWIGQDLESSDVSTGLEYQVAGSVWFSNKDAACQAMKGFFPDPNLTFAVEGIYCVRRENGQYPSEYFIKERGSSCPVGWYVTPAGCLQSPPPKTVTQTEFEDLLAPKPMPETVPLELPKPTPLPVEPSPGPWVNPEPGNNPQHRPLFVPTGDPVPNPNYDPNAQPGPNNQPWIQPGVRLNPSPAVNDPWRIDAQPVDRPKPNETPMPGPEPEAGPNANPNDKPKPDERPGLCDEYPDILACVKLDEPKDSDLQTKEIEFNVSPDSGWGAESAACPAPKQITVQGRVIPIPYDLFCTWASGLRPVILALAWLSAAFIILGAREET